MSIFTKILALIFAITGLIWSINHWVDGERNVAFKAGQAATQKLWDADREQATAALLAANAALDKKKQELDLALATQEIKDVNHQKTISALSNQLATMQLRDPNANTASSIETTGTATDSNSSNNNTSETSGVLSRPLTELLQTITREADEINNAYASCQQNSYDIRGLILP